LLADKNTYLFVAEEDGIIVGTLTLIVTNIPTGRKAWIEDVVVDEAFRGQNIGAKLVAEAMAAATTIGVRKIYLTSNPSRKAAHALYKKCGFEEYDTTVFRVNVPK
jgi:GNAT superfamily N-acetyltransferase